MTLPFKQFYYKRNRLQQLKGFCYTVQEGSIGKAARKMGLNQSTVTLQIQSLERDIGVKLFIREKQKLTVNKEGQIFYAQVINYIQGIDELFENFSHHLKQKPEMIDLAANHVSISYILPKYIKKLKEKHGGIKLRIRNITKEEAITKLLSNEIDLFIYPMRLEQVPPELEFIPLVNYQPILLIRKDHPLAQVKNLSLNHVKQYELIRIDPKFITLPAFEEIIALHRLETRIEFEMSDWEILKKFVKAEIGVAIISNICLEGEEDGLLIGRPLTNYFPEMTYGILIKKGKKPSNLLEDFINLLRTEKLLNIQQNIKQN